jgi:hypothetical protein
MTARLAVLLVVFAATGARAAGTSLGIAYAMALLDVVEEHCTATIAVDPGLRARLVVEFRKYDIGGVQSAISGPLNRFYEDFLTDMNNSREGFCSSAPALAGRAGFEGLLAAR